MYQGFRTYPVDISIVNTGEYQVFSGNEAIYLRCYKGIVRDLPPLYKRLIGAKIHSFFKELKKLHKTDAKVNEVERFDINIAQNVA
jgi:DUF438 domain-containing protein